MKRTVLTYCIVLAGLLSAESLEAQTLQEPLAAPMPRPAGENSSDQETRNDAGESISLLTADTTATRDTLPSTKVWTLNECLRYALENNIQLQQSRNNYLSGLEDTQEAKAAMLPSLTASTTQGFTNYPSTNVSDRNSYTGTYGLNAGLTLYEGGSPPYGRQAAETPEPHRCPHGRRIGE